MKIRRREPGREGKIPGDYRQDGHVAVGGIGNLARWGPSAVSEIYNENDYFCMTRTIIGMM